MDTCADPEDHAADAETGGLPDALDRSAVGALLTLAAEATGADAAAIYAGGRCLGLRTGPSTQTPEDLETTACPGGCRPQRVDTRRVRGTTRSAFSHVLPLRIDGAPLCACLCLSGAAPARAGAGTLEALIAEASAHLSLHLGRAREAVLAAEADHRIKNALQSVASYLRLQEAHTGDADARRALAAAGRHVRTIALIHDEIGRAGGAETVRLDHTMERLAALFDALTPEPVTLAVNLPPLILPRESAALVAIIANEFVTNAAKHALRPGGSVTVRITSALPPDGRLELTMTDDGPGFPPGKGSGGLGLRIVETAAAKLGASLAIGPGADGGCRLILSFRPGPTRAEEPSPAVA